MVSYRCYLVTAENKIAAATDFVAEDDTEAITKAPSTFEVSVQFPAIEVWHGRRIVGRLLRSEQ